MLEDAEHRRTAVLGGGAVPSREDVQAKLERILADLPARVQAYMADLETLLSVQQIDRGRAILGQLITEIQVHPDGTVDLCGNLEGALALVSRERKSSLCWLGEEDSNPR